MRTGGRDGFILVSVLGALIVLGGLAAAVAYLTRAAVVGAASAREALVGDALVGAGVELAGYELFSLRRTAAQVNGQRIRLNDGVVTLFASSEAGRIDLNAAPPELLAALWESIGAPGMSPQVFAARVVDYRDVDDKPFEDEGAELAQYAAAGPLKVPANGPFDSVDELQNVLDVTPQQVRLLAPVLTVHNPSGKISVLEASPQALRVVPGGGSRLVDLAATLRAQPPQPQGQDGQGQAQGGQGQDDVLQRTLGDAAKFVSLDREPRAFSVRVEAERGQSRRTVDVVLTISRAPDALYFVTDRIERPSR